MKVAKTIASFFSNYLFAFASRFEKFEFSCYRCNKLFRECSSYSNHMKNIFRLRNYSPSWVLSLIILLFLLMTSAKLFVTLELFLLTPMTLLGLVWCSVSLVEFVKVLHEALTFFYCMLMLDSLQNNTLFLCIVLIDFFYQWAVWRRVFYSTLIVSQINKFSFSSFFSVFCATAEDN